MLQLLIPTGKPAKRFQKNVERTLFVKCDVSEEENVVVAMQKVMSYFDRLDVLGNNVEIIKN